jgi:hypothetical protein
MAMWVGGDRLGGYMGEEERERERQREREREGREEWVAVN